MPDSNVKVVILAGGLGTRLAEETATRPKPMVEIGERPILWHIMKHYGQAGFTEFCIALGYKGEDIKRYFLDYHLMQGDLTVELASGKVERTPSGGEDWTVHLVDTGDGTNTGGRVKRLANHLDSTFMLTYGDGVADVDLAALLAFHRQQGKTATVTAVRPPARFGDLELAGDTVNQFAEKSQAGAGWINGGFFVFEPAILDYLEGDDTSLEHDALRRLAAAGELAAFRHGGFWQCMDTLRDKRQLEAAWAGNPPWKTWG